MTFPKAQAGVSKLFTSQILLLIAAVCGILAAVGLFLFSPAIMTIGGIAAVVLLIIAYILELVGLGQAKADDNNFKIAFFLALAALVLSIISGIFTANVTVASIFQLLSSLANICVTLFTINGIKSVAEKLNNQSLVKKANRQLWLIIIIYAIGVIAAFIGKILSASEAALVIAGILSIIGAIVEIVAYILYIILLGSAKNAFKA